jgi:hypothetical protein
MVRNSTGSIEHVYDYEIVLHIYQGGVSPFAQSGTPGMILNNKGNAHWTSIIPDSVFAMKFTDNEQHLLEIYEEMKGTKLPVQLEKSGSDWLSLLRKQMEVLNTNPSRDIREKTIETTFQLIGKMLSQLGLDPAWRKLLSNFLAEFVNCTPTFLADRPVRSSLESKKESDVAKSHEGAPSKDSVEEEAKAKSDQTGALSKFSQHTMFGKSEESAQNAYPKELSRFVKPAKQSGPKVAHALREMYQEGLKGNEAYSVEKCRDIAQRYLNYVKHNKRNFIVTDVALFIKEMEEMIKLKEAIKPKEESIDWEIEHLSISSGL